MKLATLCYVKNEGKTLMLHRIKKEKDMHKGKWNGLGGKFEAGESPEECVIREVEEESGLKIKNPKLKGMITFPGFANDDDWYTFVFVAEDFEGELIECNEGVLSWIENEEVCDLNLWEGDKIFMKWLEQDKFFTGKFVYEDNKLSNYTVNFY